MQWGGRAESTGRKRGRWEITAKSGEISDGRVITTCAAAAGLAPATTACMFARRVAGRSAAQYVWDASVANWPRWSTMDRFCEAGVKRDREGR